MGPRSNRITIVVFTVRAYYVSRKVSNTGGIMMTLAVMWFVREGGGVSRQVYSEESEKNPGCNPDTVKRSTEVSKDLGRGKVTL